VHLQSPSIAVLVTKRKTQFVSDGVGTSLGDVGVIIRTPVFGLIICTRVFGFLNGMRGDVGVTICSPILDF